MMSDSILIRSGRVIDGLGNEPRICDLLITGNRIEQVGENLETAENTRVIDAAGLRGDVDVTRAAAVLHARP